MKYIIYSFLTVVCFSADITYGQTKEKYPSVGDTLADHTFTDLDNYPGKKVSFSDFKGKWLILDIWAYGCTGCLASFPKMNELHEKFKDQIQIIMVAANKGFIGQKNDDAINKAIYHRLQKEYNLKFTVAFDSVLYNKYDVGGLPHIVIVDPNGKLYAKTTSVNSDQIESLIKNGNAVFDRAFARSEPRSNVAYNPNLPLLNTGDMANGGVDTSYLFRSLLVKWTKFMHGTQIVNLNESASQLVRQGKVEIFRSSIPDLYLTAYYGQPYWSKHDPNFYGKISAKIIVPSQDSIEFFNIKNRYCYSLTVPKEKAKPDYLRKVLQNDLQNYFGYNVTRQKMLMKAYYLEIQDNDKFTRLNSKGGASKIEGIIPYYQMTIKNSSLHDFSIFLSEYLNAPVFDKTAKSNRIDWEFNAYVKQISEVEKELNKMGLALKEGTCEMEVLVLSRENYAKSN